LDGRAIVTAASTRTVKDPMSQHAVGCKLSHVKPGNAEFRGGRLRDFFRYRGLGIALKCLDWRVS
jgi:hypothetical protein